MDSTKSTTATPVDAAALLADVRRIAGGRLFDLLGRVLGKSDDWLFDRVQKDESGDSSYLKALRALRQGREGIERGYRRKLEQGFDLLEGRPLSSLEGVSLRLVDEDELDEHLAAEVIVAALTRAYGTPLEALDRRLCLLSGRTALDDQCRNPVGPMALAEAFRDALHDVDLTSGIRVVLFKYYERELVHGLEAMLAEINGRLAVAGVLPELGNPRGAAEPAPARPAAPAPMPSGLATAAGYPVAAAGGTPAAMAAAGMAGHAAMQTQAVPIAVPTPMVAPPAIEAADQALYSTLRGLLQAWRQMNPMESPEATAGTVSMARPLGAQEVLSVLSRLQAQVPEAVNHALSDSQQSLAQLLKQELLQSARRFGLGPEKAKISPGDEDAVDLVGMLFEVLLDERDFQLPARGMIARLVVPFVKAAVLDRRLFLQKAHPARRLLNAIAEACEGNRGESHQERELLGRVGTLIDRLVAEFNEDVAIFETLEHELRAFLDQNRKRIEVAERRAAEAQRGQERLEQARTQAAAEFDRRSQGRKLPAAVEQFLRQYWQHHLTVTALREGSESEPWQVALRVADMLLAELTEAEHQRSAAWPWLFTLRQPIEGVLASSGLQGEAAEEVIRGLHDVLESLASAKPEPKLPTRLRAPGVLDAQTLPPVAAAPRLSVVGGTDTLEFDPADVETMRNLRIGVWIQLSGEDGALQPAKLSWVSPISSRRLFVNRRGVRVLVASVEELAAMKKQGRLAVREQDTAFEHALHQVLGRLREGTAA